MTRLFVQLSTAILLAVLVSFAVDIALFDHAMDREFRNNPPQFLDAIGSALQDDLADIATADLPAELARIRTANELPMELVSIDDDRISETLRSGLVAGKTVHHMTFRPGPTIFVPLDDDRVVVVGPVGGFPTPGASDAVLMLMVIVIVVFVVGFAVTYPQVRRLRVLEQATAELARGDLDVRVKMRGGGPIGDVGRRFDDMAATIQELLKRQRELVQAVAHEIRTPISRIRYGLEMASISENLHEREECEAGVEEDLVELDQLVAELLVYCRYDDGTAELPFHDIDVTELVESLVQRQRDHYPDLEIELDQPSSASAMVHSSSFQRALRNLLLNACRHAERKVIARVTSDDAAVVVEVHDDGPGVRPTERQKIFDPFARVDPSRNRASGGVGLGLAIVRRILTAHDGTVDVDESPLGGARFTSKWPRTRA